MHSCRAYKPGHNTHWVQAKVGFNDERDPELCHLLTYNGHYFYAIVDDEVRLGWSHSEEQVEHLFRTGRTAFLYHTGYLAMPGARLYPSWAGPSDCHL